MNELTKNLADAIGHLETIIVGRDPIVRCTLTRSDLMRIAVDALASLKAALAMLPASVDAPQLVVSFDSTHLQREIDRPFFDGKPFVLVDKVVRVTLDIEPPELPQEAQRVEFGEAARSFHNDQKASWVCCNGGMTPEENDVRHSRVRSKYDDHQRTPMVPVANRRDKGLHCGCFHCSEFRNRHKIFSP